MAERLIDCTNRWFYSPGCLITPQSDRLEIFRATVSLIDSKRGECSQSKNLHDYLTYLLLGWNPITLWPKESEFTTPDNEEAMVGWERCRESMKDLLDFDAECPNAWPLLTCLETCCNTFGNKSASLFVGERITMMILALSLMDRKLALNIPKDDLGTIRACMDLYYKSAKVPLENRPAAQDSALAEYASTKNPMMYCDWIRNQIDRLLRLNVPTDRFKLTIAYLGWFASLVRSHRTLRACSKCKDWLDETTVILEREVEIMSNVLWKSANNCHDDKVNDSSDLGKLAKLFRVFRIKPPPVKIRPVQARVDSQR